MRRWPGSPVRAARAFVPDRGLPGPETNQLVAGLRSAGAAADLVEVMPQASTPFFSVPAVRVLVNAASLHVFEYLTVEQATEEAARVSRDGGSVGGTQIHWISAPHFYRGNRLIVLYVGTDAAIIGSLRALLGPQFAGR